MQKSKKHYLIFLAPGFLLYCLFVIYPIFSAGLNSVCSWNGIVPKTVVGLQNYIELFSNKELVSQLGNAFFNSLKIFILSLLILLPLQLIFAYMIYTKTKGHAFLR